jgi:hypothetical protein
MIEAVAFCPQAPALVSEVGRGLDAELGEVRATSRAAIRRVAARADRIVVVGSAAQTRRYETSARGTFAGFGVPLEVGLSPADAGPVELPSALTVAAWLLRDALGQNTAATGWSVGPAAGPVGLDAGGRTALVVAGDGSARRSEKAPGHLDPRGADRDRWTADALRCGAGDALHSHPGLDDELLVGGSAAWDAVAWDTEALTWDAELLYDGAPFGVGYFVASWTARQR